MSSMRLTTSGTRNSTLLWELVEAKAQSAGAFEVELVIEDAPTGARNIVRSWSCTESEQLGIRIWDIRYRVRRDKDVHLAFTARGSCADDQQQQAFESLAHLSSEICQSWPTDTPAILSIEDHLPVLAEDTNQSAVLERQAA